MRIIVKVGPLFKWQKGKGKMNPAIFFSTSPPVIKSLFLITTNNYFEQKSAFKWALEKYESHVSIVSSTSFVSFTSYFSFSGWG